VPIRASRDSKEFVSLPFTVWGQTHTLEETQALTPTVFPFPGRIYSRVLHLFMCFWALCAPKHPAREILFSAKVSLG
jgi:hypothetical protein